MNQIFLKGNVGCEPVARNTGQMSSVFFTIAINEKRKNNPEVVYFIPVKFFGTTADTIVKYVHKGMPLLVQGKMVIEKYTPQGQNQEVQNTLVIGQRFEFCGANKNQNNQGGNQQQYQQPPQQPAQPQYPQQQQYQQPQQQQTQQPAQPPQQQNQGTNQQNNQGGGLW